MQVFIARNGSKDGPFPVWDIRAQLEDGELDPKTLGWHEGMESWKPLHKIDAIGFYKGGKTISDDEPTETDSTESKAPPEETETETKPDTKAAGTAASATPPKSDPPPRPFIDTEDEPAAKTPLASIPEIAFSHRPPVIRRFWARIFDYHFYLFSILLLTRIAGIPLSNFFSDPQRLVPDVQYFLGAIIVAFFLEAWLLSTFATTPGKWLLGMRIEEAGMGGKPPAFLRSVHRTFLFYLCGKGFLILFPFLMLFLWIYHAVSLLKRGQTYWDRRLGLRITTFPINAFNILIFVGAILAINFAISAVGGEQLAEIVEQYQLILEQNQP